MNPSYVRSFFIITLSFLLIAGCSEPSPPSPSQTPTLTYVQRTVGSTVNGEIKEIELTDSLILFGFDSADSPGTLPREIPIQVMEEAKFSRCPDGEVSGLADYVPGDKVVVEGKWMGDVFVVKSIESLFYGVEGIITAREGERLETTAGILWLDTEVRAFNSTGEQISPDELQVDDSFFGTYCDDPKSGKQILVGFNIK